MTKRSARSMRKTPTTAGRQPPVVRFCPNPYRASCCLGSAAGSCETQVRRYGPVFAINVPFFGNSVVVADPHFVEAGIPREPPTDLINVRPQTSAGSFGPGSVFALDGESEHRSAASCLAPAVPRPESIKNYEKVIEEETLRETAERGRRGTEFRTLETDEQDHPQRHFCAPVFGADGSELDYLRRIIPPWAKLGSRLATLPAPPFRHGGDT